MRGGGTINQGVCIGLGVIIAFSCNGRKGVLVAKERNESKLSYMANKVLILHWGDGLGVREYELYVLGGRVRVIVG
jgi:hypothetical protein